MGGDRVEVRRYSGAEHPVAMCPQPRAEIVTDDGQSVTLPIFHPAFDNDQIIEAAFFHGIGRETGMTAFLRDDIERFGNG